MVVVVELVPATSPTYGEGHCEALAFHSSGVRPVGMVQLWLRVARLMDVAAEGEHAMAWPSTGRLATVIRTGPAARPPRRSRRRAFVRGDPGSSSASAVSLVGGIREDQSKGHTIEAWAAFDGSKTSACAGLVIIRLFRCKRIRQSK